MTEGITCYERDEELCEDQMCLRTGCKLRNERLAPMIEHMGMVDGREKIAHAIRTFCKSLGAGSVQMSHGVERIYYAGISLDALSVAVSLALSRPADSLPGEKETLEQRLEFAEFEWNRATDGMKERDAQIERLTNQLVSVTEERDDLQGTFDLQWEADMRAIRRWQEANPGNDLVWPDRANMVVWLMEHYAKLAKGLRRIADGWENLSAERAYENCRTIAKVSLSDD